MDDRRKQPRDTVPSGAVAQDQMSPTDARTRRTVAGDIMWSRDNVVGVAFSYERDDRAPASDLDERVRKSEAKKRELQIEIQRLLGK
ncbi:MAG: PilZ domain-containing protein [Tardiphaga sp.]